jgi:hypothetical protein
MIFFSRDEDDEEQDDDEDDDCDCDYTEITVAQLPNNVRHILNTIKSCKSLVKYIKKVFEFFCINLTSSISFVEWSKSTTTTRSQ